MAERSLSHIPRVQISRHQWNEVEELAKLANQALALPGLSGRSLQVARGAMQRLMDKVRTITWHTAHDLEEWEREAKSVPEAGANLRHSRRLVPTVPIPRHNG
ncbi:MAG TPA: hypothetical protein VLU25_08785 [Acidobacteriota bacterium]|nr:hypothetical protein [Acidobacteriota bacterium]